MRSRFVLASRLSPLRLVWRVRARGLISRGAYRDADALLDRALAAYPGDLALMSLHALAAHRADRFDDALRRWQRRRDTDPTSARPWWGIFHNLVALGRQAEANAVAEEAIRRFPKNRPVMMQAALAAEHRRDWDEATRLWRLLQPRRKSDPYRSQRYAENLIRLGRLDEAGEILSRARRLAPENVGLEVAAGLLAAAREDWSTAIDILARFRASEPDNPAAREMLGRVLQLRAFASVDGVSSLASLPADVVRVEDEAVRTLLLGFESLGHDCEVGLLQRRYGAEPLGLLRWNSTTASGLLLGLAARFEGLGDPAHLRLSMERESRQYTVSDPRFDFEMHTFIFEGQVEEQRLFERMCRIVVYLRDRFLCDLAEAGKLFVFKDPGVGGDFITALHAALRLYGPVRLVWVMPVDAPRAADFPGRRAGGIVEIGDGLYAGFISRSGTATGAWDIQYEEWVAICDGATRLARRPDVGAS